MRVYLDNIIFSLQRAGGISCYWGELCRRLPLRAKVFFIEEEGAKRNVFRQQLVLPEKSVLRRKGIPSGLKRFFPHLSPVPENSIFHSSYYRPHLHPNAANVVTVYDFTYEFYRKGLPRMVHRLQKWNALRKADGIICISGNTSRDLRRFYPRLGNKKMITIPLAASDAYRVTQAQGRDANGCPGVQRAVLFVGDRMPYKNFPLAVQTVARLPSYSLYIVGHALSEEEAKVVRTHLNGRWFFFHNPDAHQLNSLYNRAACLLYPSKYEGFGIPILEAMQAGCPVIALNASSVPEVSGSAAQLVPTATVEAFSSAVTRLEDPLFRKKAIEAGLAQARKFSWGRCTERTLAFYDEVFRSKFGER